MGQVVGALEDVKFTCRCTSHIDRLLVVLCGVFAQQHDVQSRFESSDGGDVRPDLAVQDAVDGADAEVGSGGQFTHRPPGFGLAGDESSSDFLCSGGSDVIGRCVWPFGGFGYSVDGGEAFTHESGVAHFDACAIVFLIWNTLGGPAIEPNIIPLPHKVPPLPGEDFQSWVDRIAAQHSSRLGAICDRIGLRKGPNGTIFNYGVHLTPAQLTRVATATRTPEHRVARTLLATYDGTVIDLSTVLSRRDAANASLRRGATSGLWGLVWASPVASRYCNDCLREDDGAWQLSWRLSTSAVCVRHQTLLRDRCPECFLPARAGQDRGTPTYPSLQPHPGYCSNPSRYASNGSPSPCGHDLRTVPPFDASDFEPLIQAQHTLDLAATGAHPLTVGGRPAAPADYFAALRDVFAIMAALGLPQDLYGVPSEAFELFASFCAQRDTEWEHGKWNPAYRFPPRSCGATAALLPVVTALLEYPLNEGLDPLVARLGQRSKWRGLSRRLGFSPAVAEAWEELTSTQVGFTRVAAFSSVRPCPVHDDAYTYTAENIPHLIPRFTYDHRFAELLPATRPKTGQFFAALCFARVVEGCSWNQTAVALGVDPVRARTTTSACAKRVTDPMAWWTRIYELADKWASTPDLRDYGHYRYALRDLTTIDPEAWFSICQEHGESTDHDEPRRRSAAAYAWAMVTGGDWHHSPAITYAETEGQAVRSSLLAHYNRFMADAQPLFLFSITTHIRATVPAPPALTSGDESDGGVAA